MTVNFSSFNPKEKQVLILKSIDGNPICPISGAFGINGTIRYNEISELTFEVPKHYNGVDTPFYEQLIGMNVVEWQGIGQFILNNPSEKSDGVQVIKTCTAYSLEHEFTYKNIYIEPGTYNFWNPVAQGGTVMSFILDKMPSWSIGSIDSSLVGKYRTFEENGSNVYNFIKNTLQKAYNCIFDFDTFNRKINVIATSSLVPTNPIYISHNNLAKEIKIDEDTDNIFTCLGVNGADGVDIRSVNPMGTNKIYNLDYFMSNENFSDTLITKWNSWKQTFENYQKSYYNLSVEQALQTSKLLTEQAALVDIKGELISLQNVQAVIIQGIAMQTKKQEDLDKINQQIASVQSRIESQEAVIEGVTDKITSITNDMKRINSTTSFKSFFTEGELKAIDRYIKEDELVESSFVAISTESFNDPGESRSLSSASISISNSKVETVSNSSSKTIYTCRGGTISVGSISLSGEVISATIEKNSGGSAVFSAYLRNGKIESDSYPYGCLSVTGSVGSVSSSSSGVSFTVSSARVYFTRNTTEYEKRSVEWELYDYGVEVLSKLAYPTYTFKVSAANFLTAEDFVYFKNKLAFGEKLYIQIGKGDDEAPQILTPLVIGVNIDCDNLDDFDIEFSDRFASSDGEFKLADLLDQSLSMGKNVDFSKYNYSAFVDSGASTSVRDFMNSALDVAKNAVLSSKHQAITWDDAGFRLRKWTDENQTDYDPRQIWMINNNIVFTSDNWNTAEMAIGEFVDPNLGSCWGIVAPNIVGTLLAGENLVIESVKKDGDIAVFKVDAEGASLHNAKFDIYKGNAHITLNPDIGIAVGKYPLYTTDDKGAMTLKETNANFWVDTNGNVFFRGTLKAADGEFSGKLSAATGTFAGSLSAATGTFAGELKAATGTFAGSLSAAKGTFAGELSAATGTFKGSLSAATGTFAGSLSAAKGTFAGELSAATGTFKGSLSAATGTFAGSLSAATGSFKGQITGGSINIGNGNFVVDSSGNLTAKSGTFNGTLKGNTYLDSSGNNMMSGGKFKADYLSVKGMTITNSKGETTFEIDSSGNVSVSGSITMGSGSYINWSESGYDEKIEGVAGQLTGMQGSIDSIVGSLDGYQGSIDELRAELQALDLNMDGELSRVEILLGQVEDGLRGDMGALGEALDGIEAGLSGDIGILSGKVTDLQGQVSNAATDAEVTAAKDAAITAAGNLVTLLASGQYSGGTFINNRFIKTPSIVAGYFYGGTISGAVFNAFSTDENTGYFLYKSYMKFDNGTYTAYDKLASIYGGETYAADNGSALFIRTHTVSGSDYGSAIKLEATGNISITPGFEFYSGGIVYRNSSYKTKIFEAQIFDGGFIGEGWCFTANGIFHNGQQFSGSGSNVAVFG